MDEDQGKLRRALREIEQMIGDADRAGARVDPWVEQLAHVLRAAVPEEGSDEVAGRIRSDPQKSMGAHARLDPAAIRLLKD